MNIIDRNNVTVRGQGNQPILFSHGYGCDQTIWRLVTPAFEQDYEVILFDHVGAGKSDTSKYNRSKYSTLQGYADDVIEIGERLEITDGIFVGHSVSSIIGILAAIKKPRLFSKLILVGPSPCYFNENDYIGGFTYEAISDMLRLVESNYETWAKTMAPLIMGNPEHPELAEELIETFCSNKPEIAKHFAHVTFLSDNRPDLPQLQVPSLILQCSKDVIAPETVGRYLHKVLKESELHIMQATGHCPHLSAPHETIEAIHRYLKQA
ncbi:MAG: alpha/beta hydrolase [Pseudobdellovibrionaceae bacterium]|nr:alpha/beta hydrolase [Pseudobdellovibrionaceae bacterium]